jgi:Clp amino terminal domain, pathogenicity island component
MPEFPVSLDTLIEYVGSLHPGGDPLERLSDAVRVSATLDERSDALIGHFVDQARRSGAPWSSIGASMGVSKQAAQKRFVPRTDAADLLPPGEELFGRFAPRARAVLSAAAATAAATGAGSVADAHLAVAVLTQPQGVAAVVLHELGVRDDDVTAAVGVAPHPGDPDPSGAELAGIGYDESGTAALRGALTAALRLRHNYIGTEHLLLGVLLADGPAAQGLASLGLDTARVEEAVRTAVERIAARLSGGPRAAGTDTAAG